MCILFFDKFLFLLKGLKSFLFIHHLSTIIGGLLLLSGLEAWGSCPTAVFLSQPTPSPSSSTAGSIETPFTAPAYLNTLHSGQGCTLSFSGTSVPIQLMDCDGSGTEPGAWKTPSANASNGCGPISLLQTAGPVPGVEIPIGKYQVTYTAMAVDKISLDVVRVTQTFSVETMRDTDPPVIKKIKEQSLRKGDKIPNFFKIADASDNCTVQAKLRFTQQPSVGTIYDGRLKAIRLIVTDASGNEATSSIAIINY